MSQRALIFANGELPGLERIQSFIQPGDFLVAADGGSRYLRELDLLPDLLIGDLDSVDADYLKNLSGSSTIIKKYPVDKDETDLELALSHALDANYSTIRILGALGGRIDHTLGNLSLLLRADLSGCDVRLLDGQQEVMLIRDCVAITGEPGELVSLVPWGVPATGVSTTGLQYALTNETLCPHEARGISNVMEDHAAEVSLKEGLLLCFHLFNNNGEV